MLAGGGTKREYPLDLTPTGVAVGGGAVWVVGHRGRDHQVLRIDPATGRMTARTRFPARSKVDSIAFGYGAVWVMSSSTATLYRIDPRSARRTGSVVVGSPRAARPEITRYSHDIYVRTTEGGGTDVTIDPFTLTPSVGGNYGPPDWGEYRRGSGSALVVRMAERHREPAAVRKRTYPHHPCHGELRPAGRVSPR